MNDLTPVAEKLGKLIRLLKSDQPGEVVAAAKAINRTLQGAGFDIHTLADNIEAKKKFSAAEALKIYQRGLEDGCRKAHAELPATFHSVDGEPTWHEIACECEAHPQCLRPNEHEFVADMVRRTVRGGEPTEKQGHWLRAIYARSRKC